MTRRQRQWMLWGLLIVSAALVLWDRIRSEPVVASVAHTAPQTDHRKLTSVPHALPELASREAYETADGSLFTPQVPSPPPAAPVAVAAPTAPPLPFRYIGKKLENGTWEVYLAYAGHTLIARADKPLAQDYKVERIEPPTLTLRYLPMNEQQAMPIGPSLDD